MISSDISSVDDMSLDKEKPGKVEDVGQAMPDEVSLLMVWLKEIKLLSPMVLMSFLYTKSFHLHPRFGRVDHVEDHYSARLYRTITL
jgi:hypothetical protein